MMKILAIAFLIGAINAQQSFWRVCTDQPGATSPNRIVSEACDEAVGRCRITRGEVLNADVYITPVKAHARLDVRVTAYIFGIGVNVSKKLIHEFKLKKSINFSFLKLLQMTVSLKYFLKCELFN